MSSTIRLQENVVCWQLGDNGQLTLIEGDPQAFGLLHDDYHALLAQIPIEPKISINDLETGFLIHFEYSHCDSLFQGRLSVCESESKKLLIVSLVDVTSYYRSAHVVDEIISHVSHELRTPIAIILTALTNLNDEVGGALRDTQRHMVSIGLRHAERLNRLLDHLMDAGRLTSGQLQLKIHHFDLKAWITSMVADWHYHAQKKGCNIELVVSDESLFIETDEDRLGQIIYNLLHNALQHARSRIQLSVTRTNVHVRLIIEDDGDGVNPEDRERIFARFTQVKSTRHLTQGVGLGLYLVREIVQRMGGRVGVDRSQTFGGALFWIELPVQAKN